MTAELAERTYLPDQVDDLSALHDFLAARRTSSRAFVVGDSSTRAELPEELCEVLLHVVAALRAGRAVTVAPRDMTLTTQQAADILNISRPTVVRLVEDGAIPSERPGHRRQLRLSDVLAYREQRRQRQYDDLLASETPIDEGDPQATLDALKQVRKEVARRRRAQRADI